MRNCRINLPNRRYHLIGRVAHRAFEFEGLQAANRKGCAAMTRKTYCGNLLWQSGLLPPVFNRSISNFDLLGRNVYIKRRWLHKGICVDRWKVKDEFKDCPDCRKKERFEKNGLFCIEFAHVLGLCDKNFGSDRWLKWKSKVLPTGVQLTGMVIEDVDSENGGTIVSQKETTVCQDWGYYNIMAGMMGKTALYSLGRHNCRMFAELMFKDAPGKIIEE